MGFNPYTDLKLANGTKYYYWADGTIRDAAFDIDNPQNGKVINRDYKFETKIDSLGKHDKTALYIPLGGGFNYKLSDRFEVNLGICYNITTSDYLDGYSYKNVGRKFSGYNDSYLQCFVTFQYNLGSKSHLKYRDVNFAKLDNDDDDGDGVKNLYDKCAETPSGVKVDKHGCPIDSDGDGRPDYLDDEVNSKKDTIVDEHGVTLTDAMYEQLYLKDSLLTIGEWELYHSRLADKKYQDSLATAQKISDSLLALKKVVSISDSSTWKLVNGGPASKDSASKKKDPPMIVISKAQKGVVYRIQIASSSSKVQPIYFRQKFNVTDKVYVINISGTYKYYIGGFTTYEEAKAFNEKFKEKFNFGSFITPYKDGQRITIQEALGVTTK